MNSPLQSCKANFLNFLVWAMWNCCTHTQLQIRITLTYSCRGRALAVERALWLEYHLSKLQTFVTVQSISLIVKPERASRRERICPSSTADYLNFKTEQTSEGIAKVLHTNFRTKIARLKQTLNKTSISAARATKKMSLTD